MPGLGSVCAQGQESERARAGLSLAWGLSSCSDQSQDSHGSEAHCFSAEGR